MAPQYSVERIGPTSWSTLRLDYASSLELQGRNAEAASIVRIALHELQTALGPDAFYVGLAWNQLSETYTAQGDYTMAAEPAQKAYDIFRKLLGEHAQNTLIALGNLGILEYNLRHYQHACKLLGSLRQELIQTNEASAAILQSVSFYLASAETEGKIDGPSSTSALIESVNPAAIAAMEPGKDWDMRLQALRAEIQLWQGNDRPQALAALASAVAKMKQDGVPNAVLTHYEKKDSDRPWQ
jgi:tetratricopeptide (TPR) repeat protein